jgi:hypothetical protein
LHITHDRHDVSPRIEAGGTSGGYGMDFLDRPELIDTLDRDHLGALLAKTSALQGALLARLLSGDAAQSAATEIGDKLLTVEQASEILAVSKSWLYARGKNLGLAVKLGDATLRFSNAAIQGFIRESRRTR